MTKLKYRMTTEQGFTLIELLVVIAIIAVLAAFAVSALSGVQERAHITQDMNNLRQIALATQTYLNDNDGAFFLPGSNWMTSLHPKYLANWKIFQSPFDKRTPSEKGDASTPVSYGFNANAKSGTAALTSNNVTNPSVFILFAPAQSSATTVTFTANATNSVTVDKAGGSQPGGTAVGGTNNNRKRINACMADLHVENMLWTTYKDSSSDTTATQRWTP